MKAKQRTLAFLLVLVLAAGAALALLTHANRKAEQAANEAKDGSIPLLDVTGDTLEQVAVQYEGETLTLLRWVDAGRGPGLPSGRLCLRHHPHRAGRHEGKAPARGTAR